MVTRNKAASIELLIGILLAIIPGFANAEPNTVYVPDDYPTIQAAVDAANPGDTIIVRDGTYVENVDVNKDHLTITSQNRAEVTIVQAANPDDDVFYVIASYVNISGFTVSGVKTSLAGAIHISGDHGRVSNCILSENWVAINVSYGGYSEISNNIIKDTMHPAIWVCGKGYNNVVNNTISPNGSEGISLYSNYNNVNSNKISGSANPAIKIESADNNLTGNIMTGCAIGVTHDVDQLVSNNIDTTNMVNNKPVYFWKNHEGGVVPTGAGQIILVNCTNVTVRDQDMEMISGSWSFGEPIPPAIDVLYSSGCIIENNLVHGTIRLNGSSMNNTISSNEAEAIVIANLSKSNTIRLNATNQISIWLSSDNVVSHNLVFNFIPRDFDNYGIYIVASSYNTILHNKVSNRDYGITIRSWYDQHSYDNIIYLNDFLDNTNNVLYSDPNNTWNSPEQITYTYNGSTYTNYLGNYWDDYTGNDAHGDGIGDTPYIINSDQDNYPLMMPFENYFPPVEEIILSVPFFSQQDPRWKNKFLDHSDASIGLYGCALTSLSMVLRSFGMDTDPNNLNDVLTAIPAIDTDGNLYFQKVPLVLPVKVLKYRKLNTPGMNDTALATITSQLEQRNPVIADVRTPQGYQHFIVIWATVEGDYYFWDPADVNETINVWPEGYWGSYSLVSLRMYEPHSNGLSISSDCPVDLLVTDPDGQKIGKYLNEITEAIYGEFDVSLDGDLDDVIIIPKRKAGDYFIEVVPEPNVLPTDTYSLETVIDGQTMVLAEDVPIQDIPPQPYEFESKLNRADFDNDGDVDAFDLNSFVLHWLAEDCNYPSWCEGTDLDYSGRVNFVDFAIFAENWLWEKIPADIDIDGDVDFVDYAVFANHWMNENCAEPNWCEGTDFDKSGSVDMLDLATFAEYWLEGI